MLLETIQRHDSKNQVKLVCIEVLRAKGEAIPVTTVPTLVTLPERRCLIGKAVFDYLLLPGKGKLLIQVQTAATGGGPEPVASPAAAVAASTDPLDPIAFSLSSINGGAFGDSFTDINHTESTTASQLDDRSYQWAKIDDQSPIAVGNFSPEETRSKKPAIDLDQFKMQRDMDLHTQSDLNTTVVLPPSFTR
jgi:hypothetical protein